MVTLIQDVRYALRALARAPGFAAVAIATLALGIGANAAVFTLTNAVLFRPLSFPDADRLVRLTSDLTGRGISDAGLAVPELDDFRAETDIFESVAGVFRINANLTGASVTTPERIEGLLVSADYFAVMGAQPALGRLFTAADATPGIGQVAVVTHGLWMRLFGGDPAAVGRAIRLDTDLLTIVGVLPETFEHPERGLEGQPVLYAPSGFAAMPFGPPARDVAVLDGAVGRLRAGVSVARARERVASLGTSLRSAYPESYEARGWQPRILPLRDALVGGVRPSLLVLLAAVGAVLLIACANVAGLVLARNAARQHEFAVRRALGASAGRLGRQLLTESLVLGLSGGAAGVFVGAWMILALSSLVPPELPRAAGASLDRPVLLFTLGLSLLTGLLFGALPALTARAGLPAAFLRARSRSTTAGASQTRARSALVVAEMAIALMLLVSAVLLLRSFRELTSVDPGFQPEGVLAARVWLPKPNDPSTGPYFTLERQMDFYRRALEDVRALPGVESAAWVSWLPLGGERRMAPFKIEGRPDETLDIEPFIASDGYVESLGIPVLSGRAFTPADDEDAPGVVMVSESLARRYFPNENPIGQQLHRDMGPNFRAARYTIVGVVGDVRTRSLGEPPPPQIYRSLWQWSDLAMVLMARTAGEPAALGEPIRGVVRRIDPQLPLFSVRPMTDVLAGTLATRRFAMALIATFAALALVLACVGIYGVVSYLAEQRMAEIGIRVALGASPRDIVRMVLGGGLGLALIGVSVGVLAALPLTGLLGSMLYGISPFDPVTFAGAAAILTLVAAGACAIPARRAASVDPVEALRQD
jgi:putative ABC transport system permease protein